MMNDHQASIVSLLLSTFPNFQSGDGEAALAAYEIILSQADPQDLLPGITILINGSLPGHDGRFAPSAPQLAKAVRMARDKRLDQESEARSKLPRPDDWVDDPPEVKARNKARLDALAASLASEMRTGEASNSRLRGQIVQETNERFAPSGDPQATARRLGVGSGYYESEATSQRSRRGVHSGGA